jgi:two-component system, LytTR family, sensor kinase
MTTLSAAALLHIVGYLTGASLYAMLLAMVARTRGPAYRLMIGTAVLGLLWNVGELSAHLADGAGLSAMRDWLSAVSYAALGFLAALAVQAAVHSQSNDSDVRDASRRVRSVAIAGYACAAVAGVMQLVAAASHQSLPSSWALLLMTIGLAIIAPVLIVATRHQPQGHRVVWMAGLALFAVSALHIGRFHGATEGWSTELLGHHASIPLAFAILYQDYRFAFADLFLKRALTLLVLVTVIFIGWSSVATPLVASADRTPVVGVLLALWAGTALGFPWMRKQVSVFVDRVVLNRVNYARLVEDVTSELQRCTSEDAVLAGLCALLRPAISAAAVTWRSTASPVTATTKEVHIPVTDDPQYVMSVGILAGGRQLLSDDTMMLERVALLAGRRIDALRLSDERFQRLLREREIEALATEAELRALRAQINPHFLFNALTTLGYLIQNAPSRAFDTLMRLTTLLRSVLRSEGEFTTLGHERELIECYLQIEHERFEERLDARVDIPASLWHIPIPALTIQPLVENAIKHGVAPAREGGHVQVTARVDHDNGVVCIVVSNTGAPLREQPSTGGTGIGLRNVARRLECFYGEHASVMLRSLPSGETVAELRIPMNELQEERASVLVGQRER